MIDDRCYVMETEDKEDFDDVTEEEITEGDSISEIQNEMSKVKGDAIGNTLYSERWVLKLLIKLSEFTPEEWNSSFEQDLCLFWDMTTEEDVVIFLQSHDFFALLFRMFRVCGNNSRLTEILVGIVGNMCAVEIVRDALSKQEEYCFQLINLLDLEDSLTLIQLIRLFNTCLWSSRVESDCTRSNSPVNTDKSRTEVEDMEPDTLGGKDDNRWVRHIAECKEYALQHLGFYLASSTNEDLLCNTLELVETFIKIPSLGLPEVISSSAQLVSALVESLKQLLKAVKTGDTVTGNKRLYRACHVWKSVVGTAVTFQQGRINLGLEGNNLMKCLTKLMLVFTTPEALKTQDPELVMDFLYILETLHEFQIEPQVLARLIVVLHTTVSDSGSLMERSRDDSDTEHFELTDLILRTEQMVRHCLNHSEDPAAVLQVLTDPVLDFLYDIVSKDEILSKKVYNAMLKLKTNGLVQ